MKHIFSLARIHCPSDLVSSCIANSPAAIAMGDSDGSGPGRHVYGFGTQEDVVTLCAASEDVLTTGLVQPVQYELSECVRGHNQEQGCRVKDLGATQLKLLVWVVWVGFLPSGRILTCWSTAFIYIFWCNFLWARAVAKHDVCPCFGTAGLSDTRWTPALTLLLRDSKYRVFTDPADSWDSAQVRRQIPVQTSTA